MNKIFFIGLFLFGGTFCFAQFILKGTFEGEKNKKVLLKGYKGFDEVKIDSTTTNAKGNFKLTHNYKGFGILSAGDSKRVFLILNENVVDFTMPPSGRFFDIKFKKSKENKLFFEFIDEKNKIKPKEDAYLLVQSFHKEGSTIHKNLEEERQKLRKNLHKTIKKVGQNMYIKHFIPLRDIFESMPVLDESIKVVDAIMGRKLFQKLDFNSPILASSGIFNILVYRYIMFNQYKVDIVKSKEDMEKEVTKDAQYILSKIKDNEYLYNVTLNFFLEGLESMGFVNAVSDISDFVLTKEQCELNKGIEQRLKKYQKVKVGALAPNILFKGKLASKYKTLYDIPADFKLIVFYSSWCSHCKKDMPQLQKLYKKLKQKSVEIISVSGDTEKNKKDYKKFIKDFKWINYCDFKGWDSQSYVDYGIRSTPHFILLDRSNIIVNKFIDLDDLKRALNL